MVFPCNDPGGTVEYVFYNVIRDHTIEAVFSVVEIVESGERLRLLLRGAGRAYYEGESIILSVIVRGSNTLLHSPSNSMYIEVYETSPRYALLQPLEAMGNDGVGLYHIVLDTRGKEKGDYEVKCIATDGTIITIEKATFKLR